MWAVFLFSLSVLNMLLAAHSYEAGNYQTAMLNSFAAGAAIIAGLAHL